MTANNEIAQLNDRVKELKNVYTGQLLALINKLERNDVDMTSRLAKLQESSSIHEKDILEVKNMFQNKLEVILGIQACVQKSQEDFTNRFSFDNREMKESIETTIKACINNARVGLYNDLDLLIKEKENKLSNTMEIGINGIVGDIQVISNSIDVKYGTFKAKHIEDMKWIELKLETMESRIVNSLINIEPKIISLVAKQSILKAMVEEELQILTKDMGASHKQLLQVQEKMMERQNQLSLMCFCLLTLFFAMGCFYVLST